jgi:hypothetical protein
VPPGLYLADVTTDQPADTILPTAAPATAPGGVSLVTAGHFTVHRSHGPTDWLVITDFASPLAGGSLDAATAHTFTADQLGLPAGGIGSVAAAMHPIDGKLYLLVEGVTGIPSQTNGYTLLSTSDGVNLSVVGKRWVPPAPWSGAGSTAVGVGAAVATGDDLTFLVWEMAVSNPSKFKLFTLSAKAWGTDRTPSAIIDTSTYSGAFSQLFATKAIFTGGSQLYLYVGTGAAAYAVPLTCPG